MNRFWVFKLTGAPPLLSWVVRQLRPRRSDGGDSWVSVGVGRIRGAWLRGIRKVVGSAGRLGKMPNQTLQGTGGVIPIWLLSAPAAGP